MFLCKSDTLAQHDRILKYKLKKKNFAPHWMNSNPAVIRYVALALAA